MPDKRNFTNLISELDLTRRLGLEHCFVKLLLTGVEEFCDVSGINSKKEVLKLSSLWEGTSRSKSDFIIVSTCTETYEQWQFFFY